MPDLRAIQGRDSYKADAVALLERWLEKARSGEVVSVAVAADLDDGVTMELETSNHESLTERLGRLRILEAKLIARGME